MLYTGGGRQCVQGFARWHVLPVLLPRPFVHRCAASVFSCMCIVFVCLLPVLCCTALFVYSCMDFPVHRNHNTHSTLPKPNSTSQAKQRNCNLNLNATRLAKHTASYTQHNSTLRKQHKTTTQSNTTSPPHFVQLHDLFIVSSGSSFLPPESRNRVTNTWSSPLCSPSHLPARL